MQPPTKIAMMTSIRNVGQDERRDCSNADGVDRCRVDSASECVTGTSLTRHAVGTVGRDAATDDGGPAAVTCAYRTTRSATRCGVLRSDGRRERLSDPVANLPAMDFRLELVQVPVSDVDRAKAFYTDKAGFVADHDHRVNDEIRFVQLTPPGAAASIAIGTGLGAAMSPGSQQGLQLVVNDIEAARVELAGRGVEVSDVQRFPWGYFVFFSDPDGNSWAVQEIPPRE